MGLKRMMQRGMARILILISGWKLEGKIPEIRKCVIIGAPHTSNWDFYFGMIYKLYYGLNIHFLMKKELFQFPAGILLKWIGGIPVDRQRHNNLVEQLGETIRKSHSFYLALAPEGTRKAVKIWKRGFYHIAKAANVPIVLAYMDYNRKVVGVGPLFYPGSDIQRDMQAIAEFYSHITPKYPDQFHLPA